ncbi:NAD/NADP octopine/nopaline dehydrogenase family protein [Bacteroides ndongoniae]|uniref:NAD/NADP octopine/nopaline dehydrogenase family protein n=1 Tax=Bacteroides ndongoniae TaxID=1903262 RepID=UPI0023F93CE8|nr:NAD/NADP octopine/nopaline dehydrogenase family protein [Bacteroides ndongoniae]
MVIGIYGIASQSGRAFLADYLSQGYRVIGYNRPSVHGNLVIDSIRKGNGLYLERPENTNKEVSKFLTLGDSCVTTDLEYMVLNSDIVIIALPSIYQEEAVQNMCDAGIWKKRTPIVLSPSRSVATPYLWRIVGERYPIVCFSTCPYSCKAPKPDVAYIKRRKRTWIASLEGDFNLVQIEFVKRLFPQAALSTVPALTSLNNIGAVFHCATYLLNYDEIEKRKNNGEVFSFYIDGIASRPEVGHVLEEIDQVRLHIAAALGIDVFGLKENPREDVWRKLTNGLRALEAEHDNEIEILRNIRKQFLEYLNNSVLSAQHWLDITYGVVRIEGESLSQAIGRTPTYQKNSVPQLRYIEEDIPTGLVAFEALAKMLGVDCQIVTDMIDLYDSIRQDNIRKKGRNLLDFTKDYILNYLRGELK